MIVTEPLYTTADVAKICKVCIRTVCMWFDGGHIQGFRIAGSKHRRIPAVDLEKFMTEHNIPVDWLREWELRQKVIS